MVILKHGHKILDSPLSEMVPIPLLLELGRLVSVAHCGIVEVIWFRSNRVLKIHVLKL